VDVAASLVVVVALLGPSAICVLKGKYATAMFGVLGPGIPLVGALRLAKPSSWWARRFYSGDKAANASVRFARS
jgi:hypothetical protein